jgi:hypothetical protein
VAIDGLMFWVPQSGDIGMGVSIISYDGKVQFGPRHRCRPLSRPRSDRRALRRRVREAAAHHAAVAVAADGELDRRSPRRSPA